MTLIVCSACHEQILSNVAFCPHCGVRMGRSQSRPRISAALRSALQAQKDFTPLLGPAGGGNSEAVLIHELGSSIKAFGLNVDSGDVTLTSLRIVLCCHEIKTLMKLFVAPGLTVMRDSGLPHITQQVFLDDIETIEVRRHGFTKKFVTRINTGKVFTFMVTTPNAWVKALGDLGVPVSK